MINIETKDGIIEDAQVYQIGKVHGKSVAIIYGKNAYNRFQWYVEPYSNITKITPSNASFVSWNTARSGASWKGVEDLLDSETLETTKTAIVPSTDYERAIIEHKMVMITYRDASDEPCIYSRQCGVFEYGYNYAGHSALRAYQYFGSTHTESEGWKMFLLSRILSFTILDYMKPIEFAPEGFNFTGPDRDNFDCLLRADYLN